MVRAATAMYKYRTKMFEQLQLSINANLSTHFCTEQDHPSEANNRLPTDRSSFNLTLTVIIAFTQAVQWVPSGAKINAPHLFYTSNECSTFLSLMLKENLQQ
jgi:hypothetical protein